MGLVVRKGLSRHLLKSLAGEVTKWVSLSLWSCLLKGVTSLVRGLSRQSHREGGGCFLSMEGVSVKFQGASLLGEIPLGISYLSMWRSFGAISQGSQV